MRAGPSGSLFAGKVVWLKEQFRHGKPQRDVSNGDAALRSRPILGLPILSAFKAAARGCRGGTVYSPRAGKCYPAELSIGSGGRLQLTFNAGLLSKTDYSTR